MLFGVFGLGIAEIIVLGLCCTSIVGIVMLILFFTMWSGKGSVDDDARKRAADKMAADADAADDKASFGKSDKDSRFEKDSKESGFKKDSPGKDSSEPAGGGGDD